jgi:hypothetical protein
MEEGFFVKKEKRKRPGSFVLTYRRAEREGVSPLGRWSWTILKVRIFYKKIDLSQSVFS